MKCEPCKIWIPVILLIIIGFAIAYQFVEPAPPKEIRIATGREGGAYYAFAQRYKKLFESQGFELDIQPTAGSIEALEYLKAGKVSAAFIQGGTAGNLKSSGEFSSVASLFYEPLWVFVPKDRPITYLFELRGKKIAVGEKGSGAHSLAVQLLKDNDVTEQNATFLELASQAAAEQLMAGAIDAAFFVTSPTTDVIFTLFQEPSNVMLLGFKRALAYSNHYKFLTQLKLGEGTIDLQHNFPKEDITLLAATASLVVRNDIHPDMVRLLLKQAIKIHRDGGLLEARGMFPSENFVEFPMHEEASHYLESGSSWLETIFPFRVASMIDRLKVMLIPLLTLMYPLFKGAMPVYRWRVSSKIYRWYKLVREIDLWVDESKEDTTAEPRERLRMINERIERLRILQKELNTQVSVPLSYMSEFYGLRLHMHLVTFRLRELRAEVLASLKEQAAKEQAAKIPEI